MDCPKCGAKTEVYDSRPKEASTWRRRQCLAEGCGFRGTTYETWGDESACTKVVITNDEMAAACKAARKRAGYTIADVAKRSGLAFDTVKHAERVGNVTPETLDRLAAAYGLTVAGLAAAGQTNRKEYAR